MNALLPSITFWNVINYPVSQIGKILSSGVVEFSRHISRRMKSEIVRDLFVRLIHFTSPSASPVPSFEVDALRLQSLQQPFRPASFLHASARKREPCHSWVRSASGSAQVYSHTHLSNDAQSPGD